MMYNLPKSMIVPEGHEPYFNTLTGNWVFRPIKGFSEKYLREDTFVPDETTEKVLSANEDEKNSKSRNASLSKARSIKNDEFYTRLEDITEELKHYKPYFKDAVVYCPCDKLYNLGRSNFGQYFIGKFHSLGLKKLICTQYNPNGLGMAKVYDFEKCGIKWEYNGEKGDDEFVDESEIDTFFLKGNGSFDSPECREIMKNCDIVVTNPPFSRFRDFLAQIMEFNKKFIILGNMDAITCKEVFPLLQDNKIWLGYRNLGSDMYFEMPESYKEVIVKEKKQGSGWDIINGEVMGRVAKACWFTNLEHTKRKNKMYLSNSYNPIDYPKYDNFDAIEVGRVKNIPKDYDGIMGVPVSFMGKYNPEQFEILGNEYTFNISKGRCYINGKRQYSRIFIKKKQ